ncbi:hypothetical protein PCASD_13225 [Puccinia coronata f. sp. avenae]|nr:hypothetical protein PCASD_13225 [Puccinia coronata f. sp. avenae]
MYFIAQEYRLMDVESAKKTTAAGTEPCATVPRGSLQNQTFELELIPTLHKRHRDEGDAPPICKQRHGGVVEFPPLTQPAAEQPGALELNINTLPESSVMDNIHPIMTVMDWLNQRCNQYNTQFVSTKMAKNHIYW